MTAPDTDTPDSSAQAWIGLYQRRAEAAHPMWLPPAAGLRASRTNALRAGDYRETPLSTGS